jgi:protein-disulfide isomerase
VSKKKRERKQYGSGSSAVATRNEMTKFYWILGAVAVLGIGIVGYSVGSKALGNTVSEPIVMEGLEDATRLMELARPVFKGDPNAPVTIMEFADFQCPACAQYYQQVEPLIQTEFIATGRAKFAYYDFPLTDAHPNAFLAARAGRCAEDQQRFWEYHDVLYRNQNRWAGAPNPTGSFEDYAQDVGLDGDVFSACLRSDKHADVVTASMELGRQVQVPGTPTIMVTAGTGIGRRVSGSIESIREAIESIQPGG